MGVVDMATDTCTICCRCLTSVDASYDGMQHVSMTFTR